jgi:hypothetical protein
MLKLSIKFSPLTNLVFFFSELTQRKKYNGWLKLKEDLNTTEESAYILKEQEYLT